MAFYHRIPIKYIRTVPALFFAGFGTLLFAVSLKDSGFRWDAASVFLCSLIPLVFNYRMVHKVMGVLFSTISGYFVLASTFIWIVGYEEGIYMRTWEFAFATLIALCSLACSLALFYAGNTPKIKSEVAVATT